MNPFADLHLRLEPETIGRLVASALLVLLFVLLRWVVLRRVAQLVTDPRTRFRWQKGTLYGAVLIGAIVLGRLWLGGLDAVTGYIALLSAGLAIALKDPISNLAGWLFILWRRPLAVGDRVQIGEHRGDVVDLRLFQFTLLEIGSWVHADQTTGRLVHVPNGRIFTDPVANYTKGFSHIWEEFPVLVTFESDWARAEVLLQELAIRHGAAAAHVASPQMAEAAREFLLSPGGTSPEPRVYLTVVDSGVLLTVRMVCDPRHRRDLGSAFWRDVLTSFAEAGGIELAYPTTRFYAGADRATKS